MPNRGIGAHAGSTLFIVRERNIVTGSSHTLEKPARTRVIAVECVVQACRERGWV